MNEKALIKALQSISKKMDSIDKNLINMNRLSEIQKEVLKDSLEDKEGINIPITQQELEVLEIILNKINTETEVNYPEVKTLLEKVEILRKDN